MDMQTILRDESSLSVAVNALKRSVDSEKSLKDAIEIIEGLREIIYEKSYNGNRVLIDFRNKKISHTRI